MRRHVTPYCIGRPITHRGGTVLTSSVNTFDEEVDLPLPGHLESYSVINSISANKILASLRIGINTPTTCTNGQVYGRGCCFIFSLGVAFKLITENASASCGSYGVSAARYSRTEDVRVLPIVVSELKLRDVERQIFATDFVIASHDATLEDRPKTFNRIGVDCSDNMLSGFVINNTVIVVVAKTIVRGIGVGAEQTYSVGDCFADKFLDCRLIRSENDASDDIALALDRADNWRFEGIVAAPASAAALIPVAVFVFATDICFVHFNDATELLDIFNKGGADLVAHEPCGFVGTEAHVTHDLQCANALLAGQHQMHDLEPIAERLVGVLEDCPGDMGEAIGSLRGAVVALPMPRIALQFRGVCAATGAFDTLGPATPDEIGAASLFVGEHALEICDGELVDRLGSAGHRNNSLSIEGVSHA